jgi:hypothetical protein
MNATQLIDRLDAADAHALPGRAACSMNVEWRAFWSRQQIAPAAHVRIGSDRPRRRGGDRR